MNKSSGLMLLSLLPGGGILFYDDKLIPGFGEVKMPGQEGSSVYFHNRMKADLGKSVLAGLRSRNSFLRPAEPLSKDEYKPERFMRFIRMNQIS